MNRWMRCSIAILVALWMLTDSEFANAEWHYGIAFGILRDNPKGDLGFDTDIAGSVELDIDLTADEVDDIRETGLGFGGFATDGKWTINLAFSQTSYGDNPESSTSDDSLDITEWSAEYRNAEITVARNIYRSERIFIDVLGGFLYNAHEYSFDLEDSGVEDTTDIDNSWTDVLIGVNLTVPITRQWLWNNTGKIGFGGSNGYYFGSTGVTWLFAKHWSAGLLARYWTVDYENGERGDSDWYLYDVDTFSYGFIVTFIW